MKHRLVFIIVFSFLTAKVAIAQDIQQTWEFANRQYLMGKFQLALVEYQRVAFFDSEKEFNAVYQKIGDSFFAIGDYNRAIRNFDIAARLAQNDSLKTELIFKKANCHFRQDNFLFALSELFSISVINSPYLRKKLNLYMAIGNFGIGNYVDAEKHFNVAISNEAQPQLEIIFDGFEKFRKRFRPSKIKMMSMVLPGLGQIYSGHILSGLNSIVLVGGIATATVYIWQVYSFWDAALSMGSWYYRYFTGGYRNAELLAIAKVEHEKEAVYHAILELVQNNIKSVE